MIAAIAVGVFLGLALFATAPIWLPLLGGAAIVAAGMALLALLAWAVTAIPGATALLGWALGVFALGAWVYGVVDLLRE